MAERGGSTAAVAIAVIAGVASWELTRLLGEHREAWDDPVYWQLGYPLLLLAAFLLGLVWRERPWRWVVWMMGAQAAWSLLLAVVTAGAPNLLPLGLLMFALLGLPCLLAAYIGKWIGDRVLT